MSVHDPNDPHDRGTTRRTNAYSSSSGMGTGAWVVGILAAILIIGGIFWGMSGDSTNTASGPGNSPSATTGSGSGSTGAGSTTGTGGTGTTGATKSAPPAGTGATGSGSTPPATKQ